MKKWIVLMLLVAAFHALTHEAPLSVLPTAVWTFMAGMLLGRELTRHVPLPGDEGRGRT